MRETNVWKGVAAGAAGGLVAAWAMNQFPKVMKRLQNQEQERQGQPVRKEQQSGESEPATVKAAEAISESVAHHHLTEREKQVAGPAMHYAFGSLNGALYGALAEVSSAVRGGAGALFGAGLWLAADELAVPAFGLSKGPGEYPVSTHAQALASHVVYGLTTEGVRCGIRHLLG
jgi:uncharacterized membrane protein YagU involved in acid resistance